LVAAHTNDALDKPLSSYSYDEPRLIKITSVKYDVEISCFPGLYNGIELRI